jgi:molybdenum cofactor cytidylyltransferase
VSGVVALLLAAGSASRMGRDKLAASVGGVVLRDRALEPLLACAGLEVVVVARPGAPPAPSGVRVVENKEHSTGMASSIRAGVSASADADGWLIALADMPAVSSSTVDAVAVALVHGDRGIVVPVHGGRRGHPVGFSSRYRDELLQLEGDVGGRGILKAHPDDILLLDVPDPGILLDIDTTDDLQAFEERG